MKVCLQLTDTVDRFFSLIKHVKKVVFMLKGNWTNNEAKDFSCHNLFWK